MRGKLIKKRLLDPDPKYGSVTVAKLINYIMKRGKKGVAERIVYDAFDQILTTTKKEPQAVFDLAIKNISPLVEVRSHRIGGATYQVPMEVAKHRRLALALRWIIQAAKNKKGLKMSERLSSEIISASNSEGMAVKKRIDTHKMADANKAFAHFAKY